MPVYANAKIKLFGHQILPNPPLLKEGAFSIFSKVYELPPLKKGGRGDFKLNLLFCWLICLLPFTAEAQSYAAEIKSAELSTQQGQITLSADFRYQLSPAARSALQNGVPLFWTVRIEVQQERAWLWPQTLATIRIPYRLEYHALLNRYRVKNASKNEAHNFATLPAALESMAALRDFPLISQTALAPEKQIVIGLGISFEREALPLPLRPVAYLDSEWYLSSDWTLLSLPKIFAE
jgi:hypothetical protein